MIERCDLMKKVLVFLTLLFIFSASLAVAAGPEGDPAKDPKGFRGYLWGTDFEIINSREPLTFSKSEKLPNGKSLEIYLDQSKVESGRLFTYMFVDKKLAIGSITTTLEWKEDMLNAAKGVWGEPTSINKAGEIFWNFRFTRIMSRTAPEWFDISLSDPDFIKKYIEPFAE